MEDGADHDGDADCRQQVLLHFQNGSLAHVDRAIGQSESLDGFVLGGSLLKRRESPRERRRNTPGMSRTERQCSLWRIRQLDVRSGDVDRRLVGLKRPCRVRVVGSVDQQGCPSLMQDAFDTGCSIRNKI